MRGSPRWPRRGRVGRPRPAFPRSHTGPSRSGWPAGPALGRLDGGFERWRVGRVAGLDRLVEDHPLLVVGDLGLVAELDRLPELALGDRPGVVSCRLTRRVAPSGVTPRSHCRVWGAICRVASVRLGEVVHGMDQPATASPGHRIRLTVCAVGFGLGASRPSARLALIAPRTTSATTFWGRSRARRWSGAPRPVLRYDRSVTLVRTHRQRPERAGRWPRSVRSNWPTAPSQTFRQPRDQVLHLASCGSSHWWASAGSWRSRSVSSKDRSCRFGEPSQPASSTVMTGRDGSGSGRPP